MDLSYEPRRIPPPSAYGFPSSTSSSFSATSAQFLTRSSSSSSTSASSVPVDCPTTPSRSTTIKKPVVDDAKNQIKGQKTGRPVAGTKKACLCSPSTHPLAFRCVMHRNTQRGGASRSKSSSKTTSYHSSIRLRYRRVAMSNSLAKIGGLGGELAKRPLASLYRSSGHNQRRRADFQPKPSRLSVMSKAASVPDHVVMV